MVYRILRKIIGTTLLLTLLSLVFIASAQRPKVGLALAGGGAKGLAHIGILKAIDSAGLKIDYITGTSMGSIVGSLYAAGYSGKDIERITMNINWTNLFQNSANFKDITLAEKDEYNGYVVEIPVENFRSASNSGLLNPEGVWTEFLKHLYNVYDVKDFHKLNIPFECIATDLETGKPVILNSGEIVQAIRSSMAIPSVFTPIEYQGKLLVDGGLVRNFPVRYAKEMGADYLIGVSLWEGLLKKDKINNAFDVFNQITSFVDAEDAKEEKQMCNILISPPVDSFTAASFDSYKEIIRIGNEEGRKMYPRFKHLADSLNALEPIPYDPYNRLPDKSYVTIDSIEVVGVEGSQAKQLIDKMGLETKKPYSARALSNQLSTAYSSLNYKYIYYELHPTTLNHAKIRLITEEDNHKWVKFGLFYNNFLGAAVTVNYTIRNFKNTNSRSFVKASIGNNFDGVAQTKYFWGDNNRHEVKAEYRLTDLKIPIYQGSQKIFVYNTTYHSLDVSYMRYIDKYNGIGGGLTFNFRHYSPDISSNLRIKGYESHLVAYVNHTANTLDRRYFTTDGISSIFEGGYVFARGGNNKISNNANIDSLGLSSSMTNFFKAKYSFTGYQPISEKSSLVESVNAGALFNQNGIYFNEFFLGGDQSLFSHQIQFVGLKDAQVIVNSYLTALVGIQTNLFSNVYTQARVNYGWYNFMDGDNITLKPMSNKQIWGVGFTAGYFLSKWPIQAAISYSPQMGKVYGSFSIGYAFY